MHVPSDSFNGRSPEKHAALMLENLFTFAACKIALAQMQGDGRGDLGSFGGSQYVVLKEFMGENPLGGGVNAEEWLEKLLRVDRGLGLRIIETRYAYASKDYEWDQMRRVALSNMETGNIGVLRWVFNSTDVHADSSALTLSLALRASLVRQEHARKGGVRRGRGVIDRVEGMLESGSADESKASGQFWHSIFFERLNERIEHASGQATVSSPTLMHTRR